jgi:hypothetical protein
MSKEIVDQQEVSKAITPDYMTQFSGQGAEDIDSTLIEKSFLSIAHEDKEMAKLGDWYDSATGVSYGPEVIITVCKIMRSWRKFNSDFQLEAHSNDGQTWDTGVPITEDEKWKTCFIDMFVILNNEPKSLPFIISWKGTSFRNGKKLATTIAKFTKGSSEPIFGRNYTIFTEIASKGSKKYAIGNFKLNSGFNSLEVATAAANIRKMVAGLTPNIQDSNANEFTDLEID